MAASQPIRYSNSLIKVEEIYERKELIAKMLELIEHDSHETQLESLIFFLHIARCMTAEGAREFVTINSLVQHFTKQLYARESIICMVLPVLLQLVLIPLENNDDLDYIQHDMVMAGCMARLSKLSKNKKPEISSQAKTILDIGKDEFVDL